jgi:ERCC4-type nuclease
VDDLVGSIRDNRYKDQKLRLKVSSELDLNFVVGIKTFILTSLFVHVLSFSLIVIRNSAS